MARRDIGAGVLTAPLPPVMVTVKSGECVNVLTIGWTGILSTHPPRTYISVRPCRYSYELLKESGEFVINLTRASQAKIVDYVGIYTGKKVDKLKVTGITTVPSKEVGAPTIAECPLALECKVCEVIPMGTHDVFVADIVSVSADEEIIDEEGKLRLDKAELLAYAHGEYFALGEKLGSFGFSTKKEKGKGEPGGGARGSKKSEPKGKVKGKRSVSDEANLGTEELKSKPKREKGESNPEEKSRPFYLDAPRGASKSKRGRKKK